MVFKDVLEAIMLAVVIVVMAVPEGLPLMIAIVLMRNTAKMLQNNVLVRKPIGIETAGSLNILFSLIDGTFLVHTNLSLYVNSFTKDGMFTLLVVSDTHLTIISLELILQTS